MTPIVRHKKSNLLYRYIGENVFENVATGKRGAVEDDVAREIFVVNLEATQLINDFPLIFELIQKLNLKMDKQSDGGK